MPFYSGKNLVEFIIYRNDSRVYEKERSKNISLYIGRPSNVEKKNKKSSESLEVQHENSAIPFTRNL